MIKRILLAAGVLFGTIGAYAQNTKVCGTDHHYEEQKALNPELKAAEAQAKATWNAYKQSNEYKAALSQTHKKSGAPKYIIPVVVHVFYGSPGSSDNISDAQVQSEIDFLNKSFRNLNSDTIKRRAGDFNGVPFDFKQTAGDAEIEFRLARKDPNGNCTNGIVRVQTPKFADGNDNLKKTSVWDTKRYFNMWVVNTINRGPGLSVAGYAQFPFYAGGAWSALTDGVMVINREFGNIGTSSPGQTPNVTTTTHEAGHWLGLFHPFQSADPCEVENDGVDDTPPTFFNPTPNEPLRNRCDSLESNTCTDDKFTITLFDTLRETDTTYKLVPRDTLITWDRPDMQENFMDYFIGNCASNMFTKQQIARMHLCIELYRSQMVSQENLIATGVLDPASPCAPTPAFGIIVNNLPAYERQACVGTAINFVDLSYNGAAGTTFEWDFGEGATPQTSTAKNPTGISYSTPGSKTITLKVSNAVGSNTKVFQNGITILQPTVLNYPALVPDYLTAGEGWTFIGDANRRWEETTTGVYSGYRGMKLRGNNSNMFGVTYAIVSPSMDFTNATTPYIKFNYAFAPNASGTSTSSDQMMVQYSINCGLFWSNLRTLNGATLSTVPSALSSLVDFVPVNQSQWKEVLVSGATIPKQANIRFRIAFSNEGGNNLYIDNLSLGLKVGVNDLTANDIGLTVYPNPFSTTTQISYNLPAAAQTTVEVYDIVGKKVAELFDGKQTEGVQQITFDRTAFNLTNGMYFVKIKVGDSIITQKVLVN
ncbi:MAG: T9SS type A sorting domain-containing protein [Bacteroidia bacterium]